MADPSSELVRMVTGTGDPPPIAAPPGLRERAELLRRRFGLALPPPFVALSSRGETIRTAAAADGPAIAAVKWRAFGTNYRGILPDSFLDDRQVVPPVSFWTGRAMVPPSRRHRLLVWGSRGTVFGYADLGPAHGGSRPGIRAMPSGPGEASAAGVGEVYELYVDPSAQGVGGGTLLLDAAESWLGEAGFEQLELGVLAANHAAQAFYLARGWEPTGRVDHVDLGVVTFDEVRFRRRVAGARS